MLNYKFTDKEIMREVDEKAVALEVALMIDHVEKLDTEDNSLRVNLTEEDYDLLLAIQHIKIYSVIGE